MNDPAPTLSNLPSVAATYSAATLSSMIPPLRTPTPPVTPNYSESFQHPAGGGGWGRAESNDTGESAVLGKRESEDFDRSGTDGASDASARGSKRRRIAPTLVSGEVSAANASAQSDGEIIKGKGEAQERSGSR